MPVLSSRSRQQSLCALIFGIVPALTASGATLTSALKEGGRSGSAARGNRTRGAFVVVEVALALVLLVGAGLLVRSFVRLLDQNPGFDPTRTVTMRISLPAARYGAEGQRAQFLNRFFQQVDALPGVEASGAISFLPLTGLGAATSMEIRREAQARKGPGTRDGRPRDHARLSEDDGGSAPQGPALERAANPPTPRAAWLSTKPWH